MIDQARRVIANRVLEMFSPGTSILEDGRIRFHVHPYGDTDYLEKRWKLVSRGSHFPTWHRKYTRGGTSARALHQLYLFVAGKPTAGFGTWEYMCSDGVYLGGEKGQEILELLRPVWPEAKCILCGTVVTRYDWFTKGKVDGPGCYYGTGCRASNT